MLFRWPYAHALNRIASTMYLMSRRQERHMEATQQLKQQVEDLRQSFEDYRDDVKQKVSVLIARVDALAAHNQIANETANPDLVAIIAEIRQAKNDLDGAASATPANLPDPIPPVSVPSSPDPDAEPTGTTTGTTTPGTTAKLGTSDGH